MRRQWWFVSLMAVALMAGCSSRTISDSSSGEEKAQLSTAAAVPSSPANVQAPRAMAARPMPTVPVPNLIPPTASPERLPQVTTGRSDPFSTLVVPATVSVNRTRSATSGSAENTGNAGATSVAVAPVPALPPLPPLQSAPIGTSQIPTINVPSLDSPAFTPPQPLSETVEISGVVEVGGKTSIIVRVPDEQTSRYVHVGDYLGNGQVLVKRVEMGMEPVVILEESGIETTRYVGGGSSLAGLM